MAERDLIVSPKVFALQGPDGVGKTTLAPKLAEVLGARLVHGSRFQSWDIDARKKGVLADLLHQSLIDDPDKSVDRREEFLWKNAVICYGEVARLAANGERVVIDSDPVYKWMHWMRMQGADLGESFTKMSDYLVLFANGFMPQHRVNISAAGLRGSEKVTQDIFDRIRRSPTVSRFDPKSIDEVRAHLTAGEEVLNYFRSMPNEHLPIVNLNVVTPTLSPQAADIACQDLAMALRAELIGA